MNKPPPLAIVTGGTSGIGYAIAERLMDDGYDILITGRDVARGQQAAQTLQLNHDTSSTFVALDANDWEAYGVLLEAAGTRGINALVAFAAFRPTGAPYRYPVRPLSFHVVAQHRGSPSSHPHTAPAHGRSQQHCSDFLRCRGGRRASFGGLFGQQSRIKLLGKMLALDLAPNGIRVNVACPGILCQACVTSCVRAKPSVPKRIACRGQYLPEAVWAFLRIRPNTWRF